MKAEFLKSEFFKFTKFDIAIISVLLIVFGASLGYYLGTQNNFETKAITKHYS